MDASIEHGPTGGVLAVHLQAGGQRVVLVGYCRYWIDGNMAGCLNCSEHEDEFGGPIAYRWTGERFAREDQPPTEGVTVLEGEWVSDEEWARR